MKTFGEVVKEHAKNVDGFDTNYGLKCLGLKDSPENYEAANLYISALSLLAKELGYKK